MVPALRTTTFQSKEQQMLCMARKSLAIFVGVALATGLPAQDLKVRWDKGLKIGSSDKSMDFKIGGRNHSYGCRLGSWKNSRRWQCHTWRQLFLLGGHASHGTMVGQPPRTR